MGRRRHIGLERAGPWRGVVVVVRPGGTPHRCAPGFPSDVTGSAPSGPMRPSASRLLPRIPVRCQNWPAISPPRGLSVAASGPIDASASHGTGKAAPNAATAPMMVRAPRRGSTARGRASRPPRSGRRGPSRRGGGAVDDEEPNLVLGRPGDVARLAAASLRRLLDRPLDRDDDVAEMDRLARRQRECHGVRGSCPHGRVLALVRRVGGRRQEREGEDVGRAGLAHVRRVQARELGVVREGHRHRRLARSPGSGERRVHEARGHVTGDRAPGRASAG